MKRILITGQGGFTGQYLAGLLRGQGAQVFDLSFSEASGVAGGNVDLRVDKAVRECVAAIRPTHVIHLAAISFVGHGDAREFYDVNLFGTLNLLGALGALDRVPEQVLIASSANVYGVPAVEVVDETVCPAPVNHYANSKLAMENMARTWSERLPLVIVRPFNYTGVGQDERFLIPKIVGHVKRRSKILELGNLNVARDFSDVRDVAQSYAKLLDVKEAAGKTVNICTGKAHSLREILDMVFELGGHRPDVRVNPSLVRTNELPRLTGDCRLLASLTGFAPSIPLAETLRWMLSA